MTVLGQPLPSAIAQARPLITRQPEAAALARIMADRLGLETNDHVVDLHCGAGAISAALCPAAGFLMGVDRSAHHVAAAQARWARSRCRFAVASPPSFTATAATPWRYTASVWHGSFAQWSDSEILATLQALCVRFRRVDRVLLAEAGLDEVDAGAIASPPTRAQLCALAASSGWRVVASGGDNAAQEPGGFQLLLIRPQHGR